MKGDEQAEYDEAKDRIEYSHLRELDQLLRDHPPIRRMLCRSIRKARKVNPDPKTNPIGSLCDYYQFIWNYVGLLPNFTFGNAHKMTKRNISDGIAIFYFVVDQPLKELEGRGYYRPTLQFYPPFAAWMVRFVRTWGDFLNSPHSWDNKVYKRLKHSGRFGLEGNWYGQHNIWHSWNNWFSRRLVHPERSHPIAHPRDETVVVSPADSRPKGVYPLDHDGFLLDAKGVHLKFIRYHSVAELLHPASRYRRAFWDGIMTHTYLSITDYHRYHYPLSGRVVEYHKITHDVSLEVSWDPKKKTYIHKDGLGWQFSQTRAYVILETAQFGFVAVIAMGMSEVESCNFLEPVYGQHLKGEEMGYFLFGASDICMIFQKRAGFRQMAKLGEHILMGQVYGTLGNG